MITAWKALLEAKDPKEIMKNRRLAEARMEINEEVERQTHTPPKFSRDGKIVGYFSEFIPSSRQL